MSILFRYAHETFSASLCFISYVCDMLIKYVDLRDRREHQVRTRHIRFWCVWMVCLRHIRFWAVWLRDIRFWSTPDGLGIEVQVWD